MNLRSFLFLTLCVAAATPCLAQQAAPAAPAAKEPPIRRWFELQNFAVYTRYRFIETSADVITSNQMQYKEAIRARFNADAKRRYTLNIGAFSGSAFTSSWDNTGVGMGDADFHNHYVKQLYGAAIPVPGLELQVGGLYFTRGEATEFTTFDDDGYLVGERVSVRRSAALYFDEISVTRGAVELPNTPNVGKRWSGFRHPNYTQVLAAKRFSTMVASSFDYSRQAGADIVRAGVALRFKATAPLSALRYEQYYRNGPQRAAGFAVTADRPVTRWLRLQGGYATIDERYGNLNSDRFGRGRRVFALSIFQVTPALTATLFATQALHTSYAIPIATRFDAILQYDLLSALRKTGKI